MLVPTMFWTIKGSLLFGRQSAYCRRRSRRRRFPNVYTDCHKAGGVLFVLWRKNKGGLATRQIVCKKIVLSWMVVVFWYSLIFTFFPFIAVFDNRGYIKLSKPQQKSCFSNRKIKQNFNTKLTFFYIWDNFFNRLLILESLSYLLSSTNNILYLVSLYLSIIN